MFSSKLIDPFVQICLSQSQPMTNRLSQGLPLFMAKVFLLFILNLFILNILLFFGQNFSSAETALALHWCVA